MISPKEKAVELVDKYIEMNQLHSSNTKEEYGNSYLYHIKCALISVDEILNNFGLTADGKTHYTTYSAFEYYTKVKLELINMKSKTKEEIALEYAKSKTKNKTYQDYLKDAVLFGFEQAIEKREN